jgi:acetyl-CoA carboxylase carboxyltransferase component
MEAIASIKRALGYLPSNFASPTPSCEPRAPKLAALPEDFIPEQESKPFDMFTVLDAIVDEGSMYVVKELYAPEIITGFARLDGHAIGIVANQPKVKGGTLYVGSAQKAARFINLCDAFGLPLLFCADVAGFMIGSKVEREGIIRAGARMIAAVSSATVPKVSVIVRKAYGAGLYAMCGPAFDPVACIALPSASIAVMGAAAAVNAVFYNKIAQKPEGPERDAFVEQLRADYEEDISLQKIASELVVDAVLPESELRAQLIQRFTFARDRSAHAVPKKTMVWPM